MNVRVRYFGQGVLQPLSCCGLEKKPSVGWGGGNPILQYCSLSKLVTKIKAKITDYN